MAEWNENPSWIGQQSINNGEQYSPNDTVTPEDMNAFVENMQYLYSRGGDFEVNPYPVGSIYMSSNSTSPAYLFGGSWEQIYDKFLLAAGSSYYSGETGGEKSHTLTTNELPPHTHRIYAQSRGSFVGSGWTTATGGKYQVLDATTKWVYTNDSPTSSPYKTGQFQAYAKNESAVAMNNMPPYLAVYMWKRIA